MSRLFYIKNEGISMASEKFKGMVTANSAGYYKGSIINEGQKFMLELEIKDGKFPLWVNKPEGYKASVKAPAKKEEKKDSDII
jgi:hypothetical protein